MIPSAAGVALAKSGAVVGQLSCDVEVASVPSRLLDHLQDDPAQIADLASRVTRMPALRRRLQRRRRHDGIGALALIPVEAEHYLGRQAGGERFPALLLAGQPSPRQLAHRASRHPLEPVTLGESEMLDQPEGVQPDGRTGVRSVSSAKPATIASTIARYASRNASRARFPASSGPVSAMASLRAPVGSALSSVAVWWTVRGHAAYRGRSVRHGAATLGADTTDLAHHPQTPDRPRRRKYSVCRSRDKARSPY
jgi:hypothetical protein